MRARILHKFIGLIFLFSFFSPIKADAIPDAKTSIEVKTIFGPIKLQDELLRVYNLEHIQRLKGIDQSGALAYWNGIPKVSRLEHSLDMLWLVLNFGGDLKEQIAAFCYDISHTVFSQVADLISGVANYQDTIQERFLQLTNIAEIICGYDWIEKDIVPKNPAFKGLAQPLPDMCADSIACNIRTAFVFRMIHQEDIDFITSKLRFDDEKKRWYFNSKKAAKKFASLSLALTEHFWGSSDNMVVYFITSKILKQAIDLERITKPADINKLEELKTKHEDIAKYDMNFGTDKQILDKLDACDDPQIKRLIGKAKIPKTAYRILEDDEGTPDFVPKPKFRGIDPWVYNQHSKEYKRLSELDKEFAAEFKRVEAFCKKGYKIQLNIN
jgi:hypothetical protein